MFIKSFEELRTTLISSQYIQSLLHLGRGIFGSDFGSVAFVIRNDNAKYNGVYRRLFEQHVQVRSVEKIQQIFLDKTFGFYETNQNNFKKIPGKQIGYWVSSNFLNHFGEDLVGSELITREGMATADNPRFLRLWYEVSSQNFSKLNSCSDKWYPYNKGGAYRKWFGNRDYVVDWSNDGFDIKHNVDPATGRIRSHNYNGEFAFKEGLTWTAISAGSTSMRYTEEGFLWDSKGASGFAKNHLFYILGLLNSVVANSYLKLLAPTLDYKVGDIIKVPLQYRECGIQDLTHECVTISKKDWDAHETSWDFQTNELVKIDQKEAIELDDTPDTVDDVFVIRHIPDARKLSVRLDLYKKKWKRLFMKLHANEEELNRRFIEIYGLQDELTPDVPLNEITILQQGEVKITDQYSLTDSDGSVFTDEDGAILTVSGETYLDWQDDVIIKQLISYAVGCMMGRYRLDRPGLAIAHPNETPEEVAEYVIPGTDEKFWIDTDGIIPLLPENSGFHDNAVNRMATFVRQVFGNNTQSENLNFIEECLGKSLEQYFIKDFWKDHKKMYQNRPIYWLFASKKGAFQVLVYVHRMNVATVERIRSRYLLPYIERLNKRIDDLQANESTLSTKQRNQLKTLRAQVAECEEYHNRLAVIAERGIVPDLDAGIPANHALYGDIVTKLK